jgi:hypothetical protein
VAGDAGGAAALNLHLASSGCICPIGGIGIVRNVAARTQRPYTTVCDETSNSKSTVFKHPRALTTVFAWYSIYVMVNDRNVPQIRKWLAARPMTLVFSRP